MTESSYIARRETLLENLSRVRERIALAAAEAGRSPDRVRLMAVTKTMPAEDINTVIDAGVDLYGENRAQELMDKQPFLHPCEAHFIGTLQKNKVKYLIDRVSVIESVGSLSVLEEIEKRAASAHKNVRIMFEINIGAEAQKSGFLSRELEAALDAASGCRHVFVCGLMTVPPVTAEEKEAEAYFEKMQKLFIDNQGKKGDNIHMTELSMGMSHDFESAVRHGATIVRVGSAIFGARKYL